MPTIFGTSSSANKPGNQRVRIVQDGTYLPGDQLNCISTDCGPVISYLGNISGTAVFEDPGRWSQKYKLKDGFGFIFDDTDEFGNRRFYKEDVTSGLPESIHLNGGSDGGGSLAWTDPDRVEAQVDLHWGTIGDQNVLVRADVYRPAVKGPVRTQSVEYYHLVNTANGLRIKYYDIASGLYKVLNDPSTSLPLIPSADLGTEGDLVQVVRYRAVNPSETTIVYRPKVQQYRYHDGSVASVESDIRLETEGMVHQLKMSIAPQQIEFLAQHSSLSTSPTSTTLISEAVSLLAKNDASEAALVDGTSVAVYESAEKILSYTGVNDSPVVHQFLQAASCGCGSSGAQNAVFLSYDRFDWIYDFITQNPVGGGTTTESVPGKSTHIKEYGLTSFGSLPSGIPYRTSCYDLLMLGDSNTYSYRWATATLEGDGNGQNDRAWVNRTEYDRADRIVIGKTTPSGFSSYTKAGDNIAPVFNLVSSGEGLVVRYDYANENVGGTKYGPVGVTPVLTDKATYYTDADSNLQALREFLPVKDEYFRVVGSIDPDDVETVEYEYGFETDSSKRNWTHSTEERELSTENGPTGTGSTVDYWEFYDNKGNVIWRIDPDGVLTRLEYDPHTGGLVKRVENSQAPSELTAPTDAEDPLYATYHDLDLNDDGVTLSPDPFPSSTGSDGELVTEYKRDLLGRVTRVIYPGGVSRTIVREMKEDSGLPGIMYFTKTYLPHLASDTAATPKIFNGPATTRFYDAASKSLRSSGYELDVTGSYTPELIVNTSAVLGDELSRSTRTLDISGSATESTRWWDITADKSYTTTSEYDSFGRLVKVSDGNNTVSERDYDIQDRAISIRMGTTTASPETIVGYIYDGDSGAGTMVQGVGNGNLTGIVLHDGDGGTRVSRVYYDHRDRQIGVVIPDGPMNVTRYDNLDRPIEEAVYPDPSELSVIPTLSSLKSVAATTLPNTDSTVPWLNGVSRAWYSKSSYSQRGYLWNGQTAIDPSVVSPRFLEQNMWFDDDGNELASWGSNSPKIAYEYDAHDRAIKFMISDRAGDVSSLTYAGVIDVSDDNVLEQAQYSYELDSGLLKLVTSQIRAHDDTTLGSLTGANSITTYMGYAYDNAQRVVGMVDFGTNKVTNNPFSTVAGSVPVLSSYDTLDELRAATSILFGWRTYNTRGMIEDLVSIQDGTLASDEIHSRYLYDDMYRTIGTIENADAVSSISWDNTEGRYVVSGFDYTKQDTDRVTSYAYDAASNMVKRVAHIPGQSGSSTIEKVQVTEYVYGVGSGSSANPMDSLLASNNILLEVRYPDESTGEASTAVANKVRYAYNRLGELRGVTDQNGTLRTFGRDQQGRMTYDKVDTLGSFTIDGSVRTVDGAVRRLGYDYDSLGRMSSIASFSDTAGTSYRDEVQMGYTPLWQIEKVAQQHDGAVDTNSAEVLYRYSNAVPSAGDGNYTRLTDIVYPTDNNGNASDQTVQYSYATGVDDRLSRINSIGVHGFNQLGTGSLSIQDLISYERIGLGMMAKSKIMLNNTSGGTGGMDYITLDRTVEHNGTTTAGAYPALDRFGRITRHMWVPEGFATGTGGFSNKPAIVEVTHSYDRSSNRLSYNDSREGAMIPGRNRNFVYDRLNRLVEESREGLPAAAGYTAQHSGHQWALDMLGNWDSVNNDGDHDGDFTDGPSYLDTRANNSANEINGAASGLEDRRVKNGPLLATLYDYHYDDSGNLTDERVDNQLPFPPATIQDGKQHSYDAWNRLVKSVMRSSDGTVINTIGEYTYNALGWRTSKKVDTARGAYDGVLDQERTFYYGASWRILEEHIDSDLSSTLDDEWISQEFWGARYIDDSVAKRIDRGGTGDWSNGNIDLTHWYRVTDTQFSVVGVLSEHGVMHDRISYDAYGNGKHRFGGDSNGNGRVDNQDFALGTAFATIGSSGYLADLDADFNGVYEGLDIGFINATVQFMGDPLPSGWISDPNDIEGPDNSIGHAGYVFNAEREDYSVRFRVYSPELGRWMQRDRIGYLGGGNLYQYANSSPFVYSDSYGLQPGSDYIESENANSQDRRDELVCFALQEAMETGMGVGEFAKKYDPTYGMQTENFYQTHMDIPKTLLRNYGTGYQFRSEFDNASDWEIANDGLADTDMDWALVLMYVDTDYWIRPSTLFPFKGMKSIYKYGKKKWINKTNGDMSRMFSTGESEAIKLAENMLAGFGTDYFEALFDAFDCDSVLCTDSDIGPDSRGSRGGR